MSNQDAYQWLSGINAFWGRKDSNHIWVRVSGYKHMDCYEVFEKTLRKAGMFCLSDDYDKYAGQTVLLFKHK